MKAKDCPDCNCYRLAKSYALDDTICNMCVTKVKKELWETDGIEWLRKCKDCHKEANTFTDFPKSSVNGNYLNQCKSCLSIYNRVLHRKRNPKYGKRTRTPSVKYTRRIISKEKQNEAVKNIANYFKGKR